MNGYEFIILVIAITVFYDLMQKYIKRKCK